MKDWTVTANVWKETGSSEMKMIHDFVVYASSPDLAIGKAKDILDPFDRKPPMQIMVQNAYQRKEWSSIL